VLPTRFDGSFVFCSVHEVRRWSLGSKNGGFDFILRNAE
jgi:hypothetical protein